MKKITKIQLQDIRTCKSGVGYVILRIPKRVLKKLPDGYFFLDLEIKGVRGGKEA